MKISASQVKELRSRTGAGILDSKKALESTNGDIEKAIKFLQEKGTVKAAKKANRVASEGIVLTTHVNVKGLLLELNCETDFVAMNDKFKQLAKDISETLIHANFKTLEDAEEIVVNGKPLKDLIISLTTTIGEKIVLKRVEKFIAFENQIIGAYTHSNGKIASIVILENGTEEVAKNISMHVSAMNPEFLNEDSVPTNKLEEIKATILKSLENVNKPDNIKQMIMKGRLKKELAEITLENQPFVMENKISVNQYAKNNDAKIISYKRFSINNL